MADTNQQEAKGSAYGDFHRRVLEGRAALFAVVTTVAISIGGLVEIVPMFSAGLGPDRSASVTPYTPLEVAGRDIYMKEGCYLCHSQMVRPMRAELLRYGPWTRAWEYEYKVVHVHVKQRENTVYYSVYLGQSPNVNCTARRTVVYISALFLRIQLYNLQY